MKFIARRFLAALFVFVPACLAQEWEVGGMVGGSFSNDLTASNAIGSATAGFSNGPAAGAILGHDLYSRVSGELRYALDFSSLRISGAGASATFQGQAHSIDYDVLVHARSARSRVRPFALAGGGMRDFRGVGTESSYQALLRFADQNQPVDSVATFGGASSLPLHPACCCVSKCAIILAGFRRRLLHPRPGRTYPGG